MTSYPFINDLFKEVLKLSTAIEGRLHLCLHNGFEINSDNLGEVLTEFTTNLTDKKYPLALLMPPRSSGTFTGKGGDWEKYRFVMCFLKTTYTDSNNQTINRNPNTGTSQHSIPMDWHDMKRPAIGFVRMLDLVQRSADLVNTSFRLDPGEKFIEPISEVGKDRVSGVRLEFGASLFIGCDLEDFTVGDEAMINIPDLDSHPEHTL